LKKEIVQKNQYFASSVGRTPASAAILSRRVGVVFEDSNTMTKKLSVACDC